MKNSSYDLIFVTTCMDGLHISQLIDSILTSNVSVKLFVLIVNQGTISIAEVGGGSNVICVLEEGKRMGLSRARNVGLEYLKNNNISAKYIMFPDDDTTYDQVFFANFPQVLKTENCYLTPIFVRGSKEYYLGSKNNQEDLALNENQHHLVGSPNQIIIFDKIKNDIYFNENLGVGAIYGSSEDLDLFIRLQRNGAVYFYTERLYSYHPAKTDKYEGVKIRSILKRFKSYGEGYAFIIFKYSFYNKIPNYLIRPVGAWIFFMLKGEFKLSIAYLSLFFIRIFILLSFTYDKVMNK